MITGIKSINQLTRLARVFYWVIFAGGVDNRTRYSLIYTNINKGDLHERKAIDGI